jgi:xanthine dehydrogenase accessory factor
MLTREAILDRLGREGAVIRIAVEKVRGSAPREAGAAMIVFRDGAFTGTIGGGALEWLALAEAQKLFASGADAHRLDQSLGPDLGQCCGGHVTLRFDRFAAQDRDRLARMLADGDQPQGVLLFGAGHVGRALALALAPLPFALRWIDTRPGAFPSHIPAKARISTPSDPLEALTEARHGDFVAVMTHSHPLDLAIVSAALADPRFPYVGLIGSETKRVRFARRMAEAGLPAATIARLDCPIGLKEIGGKEPAAIAAGIAARLLLERARNDAASDGVNRAMTLAEDKVAS